MSVGINITRVADYPSLSLQGAAHLTTVPHGDHWDTRGMYLTLYDSPACTVAPSILNCTLACQQPKRIWSSPYTFHNCLAYPTISALRFAGNLTKEASDIATSFGIEKDSSREISDGISKSMEACASSACTKDPSYVDCDPNLSSMSNVTDIYTDIQFFANIVRLPRSRHCRLGL